MFPLMFINDVQFLSISCYTGRHLKVNRKGAQPDHRVLRSDHILHYLIDYQNEYIYTAGNCYVRYMNDYVEMFGMCCAVGQLGENQRTYHTLWYSVYSDHVPRFSQDFMIQ